MQQHVVQMWFKIVKIKSFRIQISRPKNENKRNGNLDKKVETLGKFMFVLVWSINTYTSDKIVSTQ